MVWLGFRSGHVSQHSYHLVGFYFVECDAEGAFPVQRQPVGGSVVPRVSMALEGLPPGESGCDPDRSSWSVSTHGQYLNGQVSLKWDGTDWARKTGLAEWASASAPEVGCGVGSPPTPASGVAPGRFPLTEP